MADDLALYTGFQHLLFDRPAPFVLRVTINNPERMNALGNEQHAEMERIWGVIDSDPDTRAAIITGAGHAFCAGGAFDEMPTEEQGDRLSSFTRDFGNVRALVRNIINMTKPTISAINGPAIGAGLAIALLADIPIAAKNAKLFDGHLRIGVAPGDHALLIWPLLCGLAKSKYHLLTNETVTGEQAERMNLVALSVEADDLQARAIAVATKLANTAPTALRMSKYMLNHFLRQNQAIFDLSAALELVNFGSDENLEAMRAHSAKQAPNFRETDTPFR
jgi:enoyl-CoA hydratase